MGSEFCPHRDERGWRCVLYGGHIDAHDVQPPRSAAVLAIARQERHDLERPKDDQR